MRWSNWAGDQVCAPVAYEEPASEAELIDHQEPRLSQDRATQCQHLPLTPRQKGSPPVEQRHERREQLKCRIQRLTSPS